MNAPAYIQASGIISPHNNNQAQDLPHEVIEYNTNHMRCLEPDIKGFVSPIAARRMSTTIKRAIVAAKMCIAESGVENPDAIISGTGLGCMEDTEKFLMAMIENEEKFLQPTSFIQSTHNTVSSQIAIALKCHGYNTTYVNRGFSFESSLIDSLMLLEDKQAKNVLVGSYDEMTLSYYILLSRIDYWKKQIIKNTELLSHSDSSGSIAGEGCVYFMLSGKKTEKSYAEVGDVGMVYKPENTDYLQQHITTFLEKNNLDRNDIDLLVSGINGDKDLAEMYASVHDSFPCNIAFYKHLSGEYYTASSYGFWAASRILKNQTIPDYMMLKKSTGKTNISNILVFNNYRGANVSLMLLKSC